MNFEKPLYLSNSAEKINDIEMAKELEIFYRLKNEKTFEEILLNHSKNSWNLNLLKRSNYAKCTMIGVFQKELL